MDLMPATLIDSKALLESIGASVASALLVTFTVSLAIWGATRYYDMTIDERSGPAYVALFIGGLGLLATGAIITVGLVYLATGSG
jgi:hypothetical protein